MPSMPTRGEGASYPGPPRAPVCEPSASPNRALSTRFMLCVVRVPIASCSYRSESASQSSPFIVG